MMRIYCLILLAFSCLHASGKTLDEKEFNEQVSSYFNDSNYIAVSELIAKYATQLYDQGKKEEALFYRKMNCRLVDDHLSYFKNCGLTTEHYYNYWALVCLGSQKLDKHKEAIEAYLHILPHVNNPFYSYLLPDLADYVAFSFENYKDQDLCDSVYTLNYALDYVRKRIPTKKNLDSFLRLNHSFYENRRNQAFDGVHFVKDNSLDLIDWHSRNKSYIDKLDNSSYRTEILHYYSDYFEKIRLYASSISAQRDDYNRAISLYNSILADIEKIEFLNDTIPLLKASVFANIARCCYLSNSVVDAKICADKATEFILSKIRNLDYCNIAETLAVLYHEFGNDPLAAKLKLTSMAVRDSLGWKPSATDWAMYMSYNTTDTVSTILDAGYAEKEFGDTSPSMIDIRLMESEAISKGMHMRLKRNETELANYLKNEAERTFSSIEPLIEKFKYDLKKIGLYEIKKTTLYRNLASHYGRQNKLDSAMICSQLAYNYNPVMSEKNSERFIYAIATHNDSVITKDLPLYYQSKIDNLKERLPLLGEVESPLYLSRNGLDVLPNATSLYPECGIAQKYGLNSVLIAKNVLLQYSSLNKYLSLYPELKKPYTELQEIKEKLYIENDKAEQFRLSSLYELKERPLQLKLTEIRDKEIFLTYDDIKQKLHDKEIAVEFFTYTKNFFNWTLSEPIKQYAAYIITKNSNYPIFVDLFDEESVYNTYQFQPKSYDKKADNNLYNKLWGKLSPYLKDAEKVFVSPSGFLNLINFEALEDSTACPAFENYPLYRLSSSKLLCNNGIYTKLSKKIKIIAFGGINYNKDSNYTDVTLDSLNTRGNWAYLQNTLSEVESIKKSLNEYGAKTAIYSGDEATEEQFKELNGTDFNILHIASHGFYIPSDKRNSIPYYSNSNYTQIYQDEMFYSGIVMSNGVDSWNNSSFQIEANDGILTSYEISNLDLHNVDLVVLSACETGLGDNLKDGIYGLQRAFKKAGVKSLLLSLWKIDDKITSEFMSFFYNRIAKGEEIHTAYTETVSSIKKKYPDPYYWAAFVLLD